MSTPILRLCIALLLLVTFQPPFIPLARAAPAAFPDIPPEASYGEAVRQLTSLGIVRGYPDGRFGPQDSLLRAQTAVTLVRAMGLTGTGSTHNFSDQGDIDEESWAAVRILADRDVARGFPDGTFAPTSTLTRQQAISFVSRMMVVLGRWRPQPATVLFRDVAYDHQADVATYIRYVGGVSGATGPPSGAASLLGAGGIASRGWYAETLWAALQPTLAAGSPPLPEPPATPTPATAPRPVVSPSPSPPSPIPSPAPSPLQSPPPGTVPPPTAVPSASPRPLPTAVPSAAPQYLWGLIGQTGEQLDAQYAAGIRAQVVRVSWRDYFPREGEANGVYVGQKRAELDRLRQTGFAIIIDVGLQDTPDWLHQNYADSYYLNQYGERYSGAGLVDSGDANLVFNAALRVAAARYIAAIFTDLGTDFASVRLGGGHWGELTYPSAKAGQRTNCYWAFDRQALANSPTPDWRPGEPSPNGEAARFLNWYLDSLAEFQNWQIATIRRSYSGSLMILYPGWGIRPGQFAEAAAANLSGTTPAEINGETQVGTDHARQVAAMSDPNVILVTTWLDAPFGSDDSGDPREWRPVKYLASLATGHPQKPLLYGENTGQGDRAALQFSAAQMRRFGLLGMAWCRADELLSGRYATLEDYRSVIAATR